MEKMETSRKAGLGLLALIALAMAAAYIVGATTLGGAFASLPAQTAPSSQQEATSADQQKSEAANKEEQLLNNFMTNFTSRLGMDEAALNSAFVEAMSATADQAVRDGLLTQGEADEAREMVQKGGFRALLTHGFSSGETDKDGSPGTEYANPKLAIVETMHSIGVTDEEWKSGMAAGKSLADIAAEHNVDAATLKNMILENFRAQLDAAVRDGNLTQEDADAVYDKFAPEVDEIISTAQREIKDGPVPGTR